MGNTQRELCNNIDETKTALHIILDDYDSELSSIEKITIEGMINSLRIMWTERKKTMI